MTVQLDRPLVPPAGPAILPPSEWDVEPFWGQLAEQLPLPIDRGHPFWARIWSERRVEIITGAVVSVVAVIGIVTGG